MSRKAFHIGIDLDIHAVSCPGVWLCPKGDAMLRISMLGTTANTKRVEPCFPMLFHERFHFRKTLTGVSTLSELQAELSRRCVLLQLIQWQVHGRRCVVLASFRSPLSQLLYPQTATRSTLTGVDVDLLMDTTPCFPGIIAPKIEISTKVVIEEMVNYSTHGRDSLIISHKTLTSKKGVCKAEDKTGVKGRQKSSRLRQKPVCHARPCVKCYNCKARVHGTSREPDTLSPDNTCYKPYCNKCNDIVEEQETKQGKIILKERSQNCGQWEAACPCVEDGGAKSTCDCYLCRKYQQVFSDSSPRSALVQEKSLKGRFDHSPPPSNKAKCPCLGDKLNKDNTRLRAGENWSAVEDSGDSDLILRKATNSNELRSLLRTDLDSHYRRLYERVSRRNNRR